MDNSIKISAVSYLNTKPFIHGLQLSGISVDLSLDIPSVCAKKLLNYEVDLGLVPVAIIPEMNESHLISEYCIGADGPVSTVSIFSERPLDTLKTIYLDYQSRTSVALCQFLIKNYWKLNVELVDASPGYETEIKGNTGGLVIGDRAINLKQQFPYEYDLSEHWQKHTGLPFVFATWVSNKKLPDQFIGQFNNALEIGIQEIPKLARQIPSPHPSFSIQDYYEHFIDYQFDQPKKDALKLFLDWVRDPVFVKK